jgi:hypothetical protein
MMVHTFSLSKKFAAIAGSLLLAGCAGLPALNKQTCMEEDQKSVLFGLLSSGSKTYNLDCAMNLGAHKMIESSDIGMKAVGYTILEKSGGPDVEDTAGMVRKIISEQTTRELACEVKSVEQKSTGKRQITLNNCKPTSP